MESGWQYFLRIIPIKFPEGFLSFISHVSEKLFRAGRSLLVDSPHHSLDTLQFVFYWNPLGTNENAFGRSSFLPAEGWPELWLVKATPTPILITGVQNPRPRTQEPCLHSQGLGNISFIWGIFSDAEFAKLLFCPLVGSIGRKLQRGAYFQCFVILEEMKGFKHIWLE